MLLDLAARGYRITFYEPDAYDRQKHRDIEPPEWAEVKVYPATRGGMRGVVAEAASADVVVKASGVGVFDDELLEGVVAASRPDAHPDLLGRRRAGDAGGDARHEPIMRCAARCRRSTSSSPMGAARRWCGAYEGFGARRCMPIYNALDPATHHPVAPDAAIPGRPRVPRQPPARTARRGWSSSSSSPAASWPPSRS